MHRLWHGRHHLAGGLAAAAVSGAVMLGALSVADLTFVSSQPAQIVTPTTDSGLPSAVRAAVAAIVAVQYDGSGASGVMLDSRTVVTAGHALVGRAKPDCSIATIHGSGRTSSVIATGIQYGKGTDAAILTINAGMQLHITTAELSAGGARRGGTVYFANWQNRTDGAVRTSPAVFEGTVLERQEGVYRIAVRNDAGYDVPADRLLRPGGSGGGVFDMKGHLVGVSVSVDAISASHSAGSLRQSYGVRLPAGWYQVSKAQVLDASLIAQLRRTATGCR
jgi:hypothetical protein